MELLSLLEKDSTLRSFFNVYLAHPVSKPVLAVPMICIV